jgi:hypothetical protein
MVPRVADLEIHQFWTEKLTDVSFPSFLIAKVLPMKKKKKKLRGAKNKGIKLQGI